jgi:hypothetical protein
MKTLERLTLSSFAARLEQKNELLREASKVFSGGLYTVKAAFM